MGEILAADSDVFPPSPDYHRLLVRRNGRVVMQRRFLGRSNQKSYLGDVDYDADYDGQEANDGVVRWLDGPFRS
jgi:hypothetical protein